MRSLFFVISNLFSIQLTLYVFTADIFAKDGKSRDKGEKRDYKTILDSLNKSKRGNIEQKK